LLPNIGNPDASSILDMQLRVIGLATLRARNFERILDRLALLAGPAQRALLEVGCAHGWFLAAAGRRGYAATDIEPDALVAAQAINQGYDVTIGYFPDARKARVT
jgi:hypothetical protein